MTSWPDIFGPPTLGAGASEKEIEELQRTLFAPLDENESRYGDGLNFDAREWKLPTYPLPLSYLDFLRYSNGGDFDAGERLMQFFATREVRDMMLSYHVPQYWPLAVPFVLDISGAF